MYVCVGIRLAVEGPRGEKVDVKVDNTEAVEKRPKMT